MAGGIKIRVPWYRKIKSGTWAAGVVVAGICAALYPIFVYPYFHIKEYQKIQKKQRALLHQKQENMQPGNMRVWSDPFSPRARPEQ